MPGKFQLVYFSPEELILEEKWRAMLLSLQYQQNLVAFVVDEAHCVIKGRVLSKRISSVGRNSQSHFLNCKKMALTATADNSTWQSIIQVLGMDNTSIQASPHTGQILRIMWQKGNV